MLKQSSFFIFSFALASPIKVGIFPSRYYQPLRVRAITRRGIPDFTSPAGDVSRPYSKTIRCHSERTRGISSFYLPCNSSDCTLALSEILRYFAPQNGNNVISNVGERSYTITLALREILPPCGRQNDKHLSRDFSLHRVAFFMTVKCHSERTRGISLCHPEPAASGVRDLLLLLV